MIDVIITAYNAHETIERTLISLASQSILADFSVIIVNDCSDNNYSKITSKFSDVLKIKEINLEKNVGIGAARQIGIDNSNGSFLMFVDADDIVTDSLALKGMYDYMTKNHNCVVIASPFLEEFEDGKMIKHDNDLVWVFSKMYRRSFLQKNKIVFTESRFYDDLEFNTRVRIRLSNDEYIQFLEDKIIYIWKFNKNSFTRKNNFEFMYHQSIIESINAKMKAIEMPGANPKIVKEEIMSLIFNIYNNYILLTTDRPEKKEWIEEALDTMADFWVKKGRNVFNNISESEKNKYFSKTLKKHSKHIIPKITLFEFIKILEERVKETT
jgi:glycosyltransferase involved in cell wall biosynthesis